MKMIFFDAAHTIIDLFEVPKKELFRTFCSTCSNIDIDAFNHEKGAIASEVFFQKAAADLEYFETENFWKEYYTIGLRAAGCEEYSINEAVSVLANSLKKMKLKYKLIDGIEDVLRYLKNNGYKVGIISNWDGTLKRVLADLGCIDYFDYVADSGEIGIEKPSKDIFVQALNANNCNPEDVVYVGDLYYFDIKPAIELGIKGVLYDSVNALSDEFECEIITDMKHLIEVIRK